jgi:hypothetical protein
MAQRKKAGKQLVPVSSSASNAVVPASLLDDVRNLIRQAREATAQTVNSALVLLYWEVGQRIRRDILKEKRAEYGERDFADTVGKIGGRFRQRFQRAQSRRLILR